MADTFAAPATPAGESALAVVRACGPLVPRLLAEALGLPPAPEHARRARTSWYRDLAGETLDQVVAVHYPADRSPLGRELLELSLHGNPLLVDRILADLAARGCRPAEPGEFTRTAYLEGRLDLSQAEAVGDLIRARSEAALRQSRQQLAGGLGREVQERVDELLQLLAELEAYLDFPEEDLPPEAAARPAALVERTSTALRAMIRTGDQRELLHRGIRTVLVGPVNAGKSRLLNRILGTERALVSAEAGTTRDYLQEPFALGPYPIQIYDTAGFREEGGALEAAGRDRARALAAAADFLLLVTDGTLPELPAWERLLPGPPDPERTLLLRNKVDRPDFRPAREDELPGIPRVDLSAETGAGFDAFLRAWEAQLGEGILADAESRVLYNRRHLLHLQNGLASLERAREGLAERRSPEWIIPEIRTALDELGAIVGRVDNEAMLDVLFGEFCIGK
jgi:tRNA modification GTPase